MDEDIERRFAKVEGDLSKFGDVLHPFIIGVTDRLARIESQMNSFHSTMNNLTTAVNALSNKPAIENDNMKKENSAIKVGIVVAAATWIVSQVLPKIFK